MELARANSWSLYLMSWLGLAPATILLYVAGVRANLCWWGLPTFNDSFIIRMMLKGMTIKHRAPKIRLLVTREILHQMCEALPMVLSDYYMVQLYRSMLTLAFHALPRPGEFSYLPHVIRIEHVFVDNMGCHYLPHVVQNTPIPLLPKSEGGSTTTTLPS